MPNCERCDRSLSDCDGDCSEYRYRAHAHGFYGSESESEPEPPEPAEIRGWLKDSLTVDASMIPSDAKAAAIEQTLCNLAPAMRNRLDVHMSLDGHEVYVRLRFQDTQPAACRSIDDVGAPRGTARSRVITVDERDAAITSAAEKLSAFEPRRTFHLVVKDVGDGRMIKGAVSCSGLGFQLTLAALDAVHRCLPPADRSHKRGRDGTPDMATKVTDVVRAKAPALAARAQKPKPFDAPIEACHASLPLELRKIIGELVRLGVQQISRTKIPLSLWKSHVVPYAIGKPAAGWPCALMSHHMDSIRANPCVIIVHKSTQDGLEHAVKLCGAKVITLDVPDQARDIMREIASCFEPANAARPDVGIIMQAWCVRAD